MIERTAGEAGARQTPNARDGDKENGETRQSLPVGVVVAGVDCDHAYLVQYQEEYKMPRENDVNVDKILCDTCVNFPPLSLASVITILVKRLRLQFYHLNRRGN